ncbi:hypothetical protein D3C73_1608980 [compost metagenome]
MCALQNGQSVVDRMRCSKTATLESKTGQQDVGLYDVFQCLGYHVAVTGYFGLRTIAQQHFIT